MNQLTGVLLEIQAGLLAHTGASAEPEPEGSVSAGQINQCLNIRHANHRYFIKLNSADRQPMFEAEMAGLLEIAAAGGPRVPAPLFCGAADGRSFLVMEHLVLHPQGDPVALGEGLAAMHRCRAKQFGWTIDNTIGLTPQLNTLSDDWVGFWARRRLGYQLQLAASNGYRGSLQINGERLTEGLRGFFADHQPRPALLHGDLWAGNFAYLASGEPVIFDPAVYYGDRETDLAMTELFGGFSGEFYSAYEASYPLDAGYRVRKHLYNLYHVLNHLNLFGSGYLGQAEGLIRRLLAELH